VQGAHWWSDGLVAERWAQVSGSSVACQPGCASCCRFRIQASPPEVLFIADYLTAHLSQPEQDAFSLTVRCLSEQAATMDVLAWGVSGYDCPLLLADQRCVAYDLRPFICRAWHSTNAEACRQGDCVSNAYAYAIPLRVLEGLEKGLARAGLEGEPVELITALDEVMGDAEATGSWLAGHKVFGRSAEIARKDNARIYEDMNRGGYI